MRKKIFCAPKDHDYQLGSLPNGGYYGVTSYRHILYCTKCGHHFEINTLTTTSYTSGLTWTYTSPDTSDLVLRFPTTNQTWLAGTVSRQV